MSDEITRVIASNRRARYDYEILETAEAGIALTGAEIKSVRDGRVNIREAYAQVRDGEITLLNMHVAPFKGASHYSIEEDSTRPRKLLLHKSQIRRFGLAVDRDRLTLIPLRIYIRNHLAKIEIALGRGKRQYDRRETIRRRDAEREIARAVRRGD